MRVNRRFVACRHHISSLEDLQIVVERDSAEGDGNGDESKRKRATGNAEHSCEEIELCPEADERRNSGEREEEYEQNGGEQRVALVQAEEGVELVAACSALSSGGPHPQRRRRQWW